jgi:hypothetical protein
MVVDGGRGMRGSGDRAGRVNPWISRRTATVAKGESGTLARVNVAKPIAILRSRPSFFQRAALCLDPLVRCAHAMPELL